MDLLSDVLKLLKPRSYLSAGLDAGGDWSIRFGNQAGAIKCQAVTSGTCWMAVDGVDAPLRLIAGDCLVVPSGRAFTLASDLSLPSLDVAGILGPAQPGEVIVHQGGGGFTFVGTRFEVDGRKARALLGALPPVVHLRAAEGQAALRWCIEQMMAEMQGKRPGSTLAAHHLAHLMLLQAFRLHLSGEGGERVGLLYALADPQLARAIEAVHAAPGHGWTLAEMAALAGMSRSVFAARFRARVGDTPLAYLTRWRMMLATEQLADGRATLARIAQSLGYDSENAFNTAFRRVMGCSPRRYARQEAGEGSEAGEAAGLGDAESGSISLSA